MDIDQDPFLFSAENGGVNTMDEQQGIYDPINGCIDPRRMFNGSAVGWEFNDISNEVCGLPASQQLIDSPVMGYSDPLFENMHNPDILISDQEYGIQPTSSPMQSPFTLPFDHVMADAPYDGSTNPQDAINNLHLTPRNKQHQPRPLSKGTGSGKKKEACRPKLSQEAISILEEWFSREAYPSTENKAMLAAKTDLKPNQVKNWFDNKRKRSIRINIQQVESESQVNSELAGGHSPETSIYATTENIPLSWRDPPIDNLLSPSRCKRPTYARSSTGSHNSTDSAYSYTSPSMTSPPRQGKRIVSQPDLGRTRERCSQTLSDKSDSKTQYPCTFCSLILEQRTWRRHEESHHLPSKTWTCHSDQSFIQKPGEPLACVFCGVPIPPEGYCKTDHKIHQCIKKSKQARTFRRKDGLAQHFRQVHDVKLSDDTAAAWCTGNRCEDKNLNCGFCGEKIQRVDKRALHIPTHFRAGLTMDFWDLDNRLASIDITEDIRNILNELLTIRKTQGSVISPDTSRVRQRILEADLVPKKARECLTSGACGVSELCHYFGPLIARMERVPSEGGSALCNELGDMSLEPLHDPQEKHTESTPAVDTLLGYMGGWAPSGPDQARDENNLTWQSEGWRPFGNAVDS